MFSYENICLNKEMFKSTTGREADDFQTVFEFFRNGTLCENIKFYDVKITKSLKAILKMLNLEKRQSSYQSMSFFMHLSWLRNDFTPYKNAF